MSPVSAGILLASSLSQHSIFISNPPPTLASLRSLSLCSFCLARRGGSLLDLPLNLTGFSTLTFTPFGFAITWWWNLITHIHVWNLHQVFYPKQTKLHLFFSRNRDHLQVSPTHVIFNLLYFLDFLTDPCWSMKCLPHNWYFSTLWLNRD